MSTSDQAFEFRKFLAQPGLKFERTEENSRKLSAMMLALRSAFPLNYDVIGFNAANQALIAVENAKALYARQPKVEEPIVKGEARIIGI